jgi:hypothetical protein
MLDRYNLMDELKPQYENMSQYELTKILKPLIPVYLEMLNNKERTLEAEEQLTQLGAKIDAIGEVKREKMYQDQERSAQEIQEGRAYNVSPLNFIDYHKTGTIQEQAYKDYEKTGGLSWLGGKEKKPLLVATKNIDGEAIEFRQSGEELKYTQRDPKDPDGFDHLRDDKGNLTYMTQKQMKEKGLPIYETSIVAYNEKGEPIGLASNEFGADGIWVEKRYQKKGIGSTILHLFRKQFKPGRKMGQMTGSGQSLARAYHKKIIEEAIKEKKPVPQEILEWYELV